jgi:hypothetical protein
MDRIDLSILFTLFVGGYVEHGDIHGAMKWIYTTLCFYTVITIFLSVYLCKMGREEKEKAYIKNMIKHEPIETVIKFVRLSRNQRDLIIYS